MQLFDTHAHLDQPEFDDAQPVIQCRPASPFGSEVMAEVFQACHLTSDSRPRRLWGIFGLLVGIHVAFQVFLDPVGVTADDIPEWLGMALMGFVITQPALFGLWGTLGPGTFHMRIPITLAALLAVCLAGAVKQWNIWWPAGTPVTIDTGELAWTFTFFTLVMGIVYPVRRFAGWRIASPLEETHAAQSNQFSLKFLFGLTTACAVLLGIGRGWASTDSSAVVFAGICLLLLFPVLVLPFVVLSVRPTLRHLLLMPFLWTALTWLATEAAASMNNVPRAQVAGQLAFVQLGMAVASLTAAIVLRFGGYRFYRPSAALAEPNSASNS